MTVFTDHTAIKDTSSPSGKHARWWLIVCRREMEVCKLMGVQKLITMAYHPQCNGMVEHFNRTLKTALSKHAACFGVQWDQYTVLVWSLVGPQKYSA